jgi:integrase
MATYPERRNGKLTGKWIAEVTASGDRRRKRFDTKRDGEHWADFIKLTGAPPAEAGVVVGPTFGSVKAEALEHHAGWQADRDPSLGQRLDYAEACLGKDTLIADVRATDLDRLVGSLKNRPGIRGKLSAGTINRYLAAASAVLTFAKKRAYIVGVPSVPWQKETGHRIHWLPEAAEDAVVAALRAAGHPEAALTVRVLIATGMRWSEFEGLEPAMVDAGWIKLTETKTDTPRDVPIDADLSSDLRRMLAANSAPGYDTFRHYFKAALKTAGQSDDISIHSLRHTTATRLVHGGVNLAVVKDFMGHSSLNTTLKYTHVTKSLLSEAAKILSPRAGQTAKIPHGALVTFVEDNAMDEGELEAVSSPVLN